MVYRKYLKHLAEFLALFVPEHTLTYEELSAISDQYLDAATGVLPFLGPCIFDASNFLGMANAVFIEGETVNPFMALVPSFIENLAFAIVANIEQLEKISGTQIQTIRMTGGGNRNKLLTKILPLLLEGRIITRSAFTEATSRGAAIQAFVANEVFPNLQSAAATMMEPYDAVDSTTMQAERARYVKKYGEWKKRHAQISEFF
jgi:sugar (pentulose or hexulose) kinase